MFRSITAIALCMTSSSAFVATNHVSCCVPKVLSLRTQTTNRGLNNYNGVWGPIILYSCNNE